MQCLIDSRMDYLYKKIIIVLILFIVQSNAYHMEPRINFHPNTLRIRRQCGGYDANDFSPCTKVNQLKPGKDHKSYQQCLNINGTLAPVSKTCPCGHYFDKKEKKCTKTPGGGDVVFVDYCGQCKDKYLGTLVHPTQAQFYYVCKECLVLVMKCPRLQIYDSKEEKCVNIINPCTLTIHDESDGSIDPPPCKSSGRYPVPFHPQYFLMCTEDGDKFYRSIFKCPLGAQYDVETQSCSELYTGLTTTPKLIDWYLEKDPYPPCVKPGRFRSPRNCSMYYVCSAKSHGTFYQLRFCCPSGNHFCIETLQCRPAQEVHCNISQSNCTDDTNCVCYTSEFSNTTLGITESYKSTPSTAPDTVYSSTTTEYIKLESTTKYVLTDEKKRNYTSDDVTDKTQTENISEETTHENTAINILSEEKLNHEEIVEHEINEDEMLSLHQNVTINDGIKLTIENMNTNNDTYANIMIASASAENITEFSVLTTESTHITRGTNVIKEKTEETRQNNTSNDKLKEENDNLTPTTEKVILMLNKTLSESSEKRKDSIMTKPLNEESMSTERENIILALEQDLNSTTQKIITATPLEFKHTNESTTEIYNESEFPRIETRTTFTDVDFYTDDEPSTAKNIVNKLYETTSNQDVEYQTEETSTSTYNNLEDATMTGTSIYEISEYTTGEMSSSANDVEDINNERNINGYEDWEQVTYETRTNKNLEDVTNENSPSTYEYLENTTNESTTSTYDDSTDETNTASYGGLEDVSNDADDLDDEDKIEDVIDEKHTNTAGYLKDDTGTSSNGEGEASHALYETNSNEDSKPATYDMNSNEDEDSKHAPYEINSNEDEDPKHVPYEANPNDDSKHNPYETNSNEDSKRAPYEANSNEDSEHAPYETNLNEDSKYTTYEASTSEYEVSEDASYESSTKEDTGDVTYGTSTNEYGEMEDATYETNTNKEEDVNLAPYETNSNEGSKSGTYEMNSNEDEDLKHVPHEANPNDDSKHNPYETKSNEDSKHAPYETSNDDSKRDPYDTNSSDDSKHVLFEANSNDDSKHNPYETNSNEDSKHAPYEINSNQDSEHDTYEASTNEYEVSEDTTYESSTNEDTEDAMYETGTNKYGEVEDATYEKSTNEDEGATYESSTNDDTEDDMYETGTNEYGEVEDATYETSTNEDEGATYESSTNDDTEDAMYETGTNEYGEVEDATYEKSTNEDEGATYESSTNEDTYETGTNEYGEVEDATYETSTNDDEGATHESSTNGDTYETGTNEYGEVEDATYETSTNEDEGATYESSTNEDTEDPMYETDANEYGEVEDATYETSTINEHVTNEARGNNEGSTNGAVEFKTQNPVTVVIDGENKHILTTYAYAEITTESGQVTPECSTTNILEQNLPECTSQGMFSLNGSCNFYYHCQLKEDGRLEAALQECPKCLRFNEEKGYCDLPINVPRCLPEPLRKQEKCVKEGLYPINGECQKFKKCFRNKYKEFEYKIVTCPLGMNFNPKTKECDTSFKCSELRPHPKCLRSGYFPDEEMCDEFYQCIEKNSTKNGSVRFSFARHKCPTGMVFNDKKGFCDLPKNVPWCANLDIS